MVSKYLVRKLKTGSLNKSKEIQKIAPPKNIPKEKKERVFSYENFENDCEYISDMYYGTIGDTFYYFCIPGDMPLLWNSNNLMKDKYINDEIIESLHAYEKKYFNLSLKDSSVRTEYSSFNLIETPISELEEFIDKRDKGQFYYASIRRDDNNNWWKLNIINSLFLMNRSEKQLKDYLSYFDEEQQQEIICNSIENLESVGEELIKVSSDFEYYLNDLNNILFKLDMSKAIKSELKNKRLKF